MPLRIVRLGSPRHPEEGLRLGTVRRLPRGVRKQDYAVLDWFDLWLPELAPSPALLSFATAKPLTGKRWSTFARRYRSEMRKPAARRLIALLAALSRQGSFAVGCYCADGARCHRVLLGKLMIEAGAVMAGQIPDPV